MRVIFGHRLYRQRTDRKQVHRLVVLSGVGLGSSGGITPRRIGHDGAVLHAASLPRSGSSQTLISVRGMRLPMYLRAWISITWLSSTNTRRHSESKTSLIA